LAKRRREFFAPLAIPVSLPKFSVWKVAILSLSPKARQRKTIARLLCDSGTVRS